MKNRIITQPNYGTQNQDKFPEVRNSEFPDQPDVTNQSLEFPDDRAEILVITSYPPRECGIATYSQDLIRSLSNKFSQSFSFKVCALESGDTSYAYPEEVKFVLKTSEISAYQKLAFDINSDNQIKVVLIQHEFGLFLRQEQEFQKLLELINKPVVIVFHTVLPNPDEILKLKIQRIAAYSASIVVMTHTSFEILTSAYNVPEQMISVIAHGTHLVTHLSEKFLKEKYNLKNRKVLTTFGLLSSGKGIKTTLEALPAIIEKCPEVLFLVIGKTHPEVVLSEGEKYREMLHEIVKQLNLEKHVRFINKYLPLSELLEYLQLTDIYIFSANDPNQAVSGTFAYAMSCACPIISTPIPHAREVLTEDTGIIFDFLNSLQLAEAAIRILSDDELRSHMSVNSLQKIASTAWENSAVAHATLFDQILNDKRPLKFNNPEINLDHLKKMTTEVGIIQFSKINQPDLNTGYTLDDNARAMIAMCMYYKSTGDKESIKYIYQYLSFIKYCQQPEGDFLNYTDQNNEFTDQNDEVNLDDSNGRAIWALGYLLSISEFLPSGIISEADIIIEKTFPFIEAMHSTRAMAFSLKGLYYYHQSIKSPENLVLITKLANRLVRMYKHESEKGWEWFESYLTYANSILPEAMLYAWKLTGDNVYKEIAQKSFTFLLSKIFTEKGIEVISNRKWLQKGEQAGSFGEQPIDVAYTIMTLSKFYDAFQDENYKTKMGTAFNWFLGDNRLRQIMYNPCTGGCYDGMEDSNVNLNQGAESTVSYLMARLTIEKYSTAHVPAKPELRKHFKVVHKHEKPIYSSNTQMQTNQVVLVSNNMNL
jgi:glycosyltransferase involved in cell wall biosynthesis